MGGVYQWVGSILCYLILATAVRAVLPSKKYEKYIRFFMGVMLILVAVRPVAEGLNLEDRLAYYFEAVSFQRESEDLKREILGIEEQRLKKVIEEYEGAVERDVRLMAEDMGFAVRKAEVSIESEKSNENYGEVRRVFMVVGRERNETGGTGETEEEGNAVGNRAERIQIGTIEIEPVEAGGEAENGELQGKGKTGEEQDREEADGKNMGGEDKADLERLRRKVERYYGLEQWEVEVEFEGR